MAGLIMAGQTSNYNFDYPTSTDYVKDGATAIQELADDVDSTLFTALGGDYPGLRLVKSQVVGSAVSSVTLTDAFSATYDSYKIIWTGGVGSTNIDLQLKLGSTITNYAYSAVYTTFNSTVTGAGSTTNTFFPFGGFAAANRAGANFELHAPFLTQETFYNAQQVGFNAGINTVGYQNSDTSFTDFTLTCSSGNITGGTIRVYGYGAS
jgi:hypothetical protein